MKYLADGGHQVVSLVELIRSLKDGTRLSAKTVVLTFDDGFSNFYTEAFPVLCEYNFSEPFFSLRVVAESSTIGKEIPMQFLGSKLLSWKEVRELDRFGIEIGSHTKTHRDLTRLGSQDAEREIIDSKAEIEDEVGREAATFAYPFGWMNPTVRQIAADNFDAACSTELGKVTKASDFYSLRRLDAYYLSNQRLFAMHGSATFDNYMRFRQALRSVKHSFLRA